jgi:hypothetical protein
VLNTKRISRIKPLGEEVHQIRKEVHQIDVRLARVEEAVKNPA